MKKWYLVIIVLTVILSGISCVLNLSGFPQLPQAKFMH